MTTPNSRLAYKMFFDLFDQALADPKGIRIKQTDAGAAWYMRLQFHHARSLDRKDNAQTYDVGHILHGCSVYDTLLVTIDQEGDQVWLYIHKREASNFHVESLASLAPPEEIAVAAEQDFKTPAEVLDEATEVDRRL